MNSHRLLRTATSLLLATSLGAAPWGVAFAAPAEGGVDEAAPAETPEEEEPSAQEPGTEEAGATEPGAEPAEGEATPPEGDEAAGEAPTAGDEVAGTEGEGEEGEEAAATEEAPADMEPDEPEGPERPDEPRWGKESQHPMKGTGMIVAGTATTLLGVGFIGLAFGITKCDDGTEPGCKYAPNRTFLVPSAITATGTGVLLLAVGLGLRKKYKNWENWSPEQAMVSPAIYEGGGGVTVGGRF